MAMCEEIQTGVHSGPFRPIRLAMSQGAAAILLAIAAFLVSLQPAWSMLARPGDARSGSLLLKSEAGYAEAARLGIDIDLTVSGPTIRGRVTQIFRNPTNDWIEAIYVYPLAEGGAVDSLKMVIGDRIVVGDIKERQAARIAYEQAREQGRKAALTEQERPNIFTNSVANIGPGETVLVQIEYQEPVRQSSGEFSLRVPLVVGPRFNPAPVVQSVDLRPSENGWGASVTDPVPNRTDPVPDRDRITPPVLDPALHRAGQSDPDQRAPRRRLPARRDEEPSSRRQARDARRRDAHRHARRPGAGRSRLRAHLEAGGREGAVGRAVPRARRRCRLPAGVHHAAGARAGRTRSRCRAR